MLIWLLILHIGLLVKGYTSPPERSSFLPFFFFFFLCSDHHHVFSFRKYFWYWDDLQSFEDAYDYTAGELQAKHETFLTLEK